MSRCPSCQEASNAEKHALGMAASLARENERLRAALDNIGAMFFVGVGGAVLLKPDFGSYDVLDAANAALASCQQEEDATKP